MNASMAGLAESDEVVLGVVASVTSKLEVVHLESLHAAAKLAAPSVALKHLSVEFPVRCQIEFEARPHAHDAVPASCSTKACSCEAGRNLW